MAQVSLEDWNWFFYVVGVLAQVLPWTKKKNHPRDSRREERCSTCDIMLDQARSAQGKSRGQWRIGLALCWSSLIEHDITRGTAFFSPRISMMVLFFVQGSRLYLIEITCFLLGQTNSLTNTTAILVKMLELKKNQLVVLRESTWYTVRSGAEERTFWGARLDVLIFRLRSYFVLISYTTEFNGPKIRKTLMFLGQAGTFLSFQARRSSATRSSTSDLTVVQVHVNGVCANTSLRKIAIFRTVLNLAPSTI